MSWIRARAYRDGEFLLGRISEQLDSDIKEFNQLPGSVRGNRIFGLQRTSIDSRLLAIVYISFTDGQKMEAIRILTHKNREGELIALMLLSPGGNKQHRIKAIWSLESDSERWFLDDEEKESPMTVSDVSRTLLEPTLFTT